MSPSWRFWPRALVVGLTALVAGTCPPALAAPANDNFAQRITLPIGTTDTRSNIDATIETGERLTVNDPESRGCTQAGTMTSEGRRMDGTLWWEFTGNGAPITVSTTGTPFDTIIGIHDLDSGLMIGCNDDIGLGMIDTRTASEIVVPSTTGRRYAVQVGGCVGTYPTCDHLTAGTIGLRISQPPANDGRAAALSVTPPVTPATTATYGATVEAGERLECGTSRYARTVWFRFRAQAVGTAVFSAGGFDTVMAVYREGAAAPIACNDDAAPNQETSRIPAIQPAGTPMTVEPGDYLIQVGGYYDSALTTVAARGGPLTLQVDYTEDLDRDDDGYNRGVDCSDLDPAVHPGASEVPNNDVDEDCDGVFAYDRDGDGVLASAGDCRDDLASVHPGAVESPGNGIDENCDGADGTVLANRDRDGDGVLDPPYGDDCNPNSARIRPGANDVPENGVDEDCRGGDAALPSIGVRFRIVWQVGADLTRAERLEVKSVPAGTRIELRCKGGGCTFKKRATNVRRRTSTLALTKGLRGGISLRKNATVEIRVTKSGYAGAVRAYRMRSGKPPTLTEYCLRKRGRLKGAC